MHPPNTHLFFLKDDLVEEVLKVLISIINTQLLKAVETQVLPGTWGGWVGPSLASNPATPISTAQA